MKAYKKGIDSLSVSGIIPTNERKGILCSFFEIIYRYRIIRSIPYADSAYVCI